MSGLEKLECHGCSATVQMAKDGYYLECPYCRSRYGLPESMTKTKPQAVMGHMIFDSYDSYVSASTYPDTTDMGVVVQPWRQ